MRTSGTGPHYLVTGGCGFIGRHLIRTLIKGGARVTVLDDLSNSTPSGMAEDAELTVGSVTDDAAVASAMQGVDGCFHLAAIASVPQCEADWLRSHQVNCGGTVSVLNAARTAGSRPVPVVFASSAAVYGDQGVGAIGEDAAPRPGSVYGADKLAGEVNGRVAASSFGVPFTALRFFNVYGPGQDPRSPYSGVISRFADLALAGESLTVFGDGEQTRDFVYVGDVVRHLVAAMETSAAEPRVLNVCSGRETSVNELATLISEAAGRPANVVRQPRRAFEIVRSLGDPSRARAALGLAADHDLRAGLGELLAHLAAARATSDQRELTALPLSA